ncbi:MAG: PTS sugar transporter subunit IIA [Erysipelotrichaceae bacterium]|nr:PTS sugar transporter subunit IIA [Erysipelotrichaceae bacterium]MBQ1482910.1 PTS sugar transporter subunit IIA [Erysipelotrichaceae bacterium]
MIRKKEKELIRILLSSHEGMSGAAIGEKMQITARSVKNYVRQINDAYKQKVVLSSRDGYFLNPQMIPLLSSEQDEEEVPETSQDRIAYIVKQIISSPGSQLDLFDLADELCISYSTLRSLIARMNKIYASYNVRFTSSNDKLTIQGEESDKRKFFTFIINENASSSIVSKETLEAYFSNIDINVLTSIITSTFRDYGYYLNDFAALNLLLHLAIIIDRSLSGSDLNRGNRDLEITDEHEKRFIEALFAKLEETFKFTLNPYEQYEIYMLFKANANYTLVTLEDDLKGVVGTDIIKLTNHYVKQIGELYMIDLSSDTFKTAFALHLKNLIFRASLGKSTFNPMLASIKIGSPLVFDMAIYVAMDLMERYALSINEEETAFLAIHIGSEIERQSINRGKLPCILLCPDYLDIRGRILNELLIQFGNQIDIVHTFSSQDDLSKLTAEENISLLFTTIPLILNPGCKVIELSPLNIRKQYESIQDVIDELSQAKKNEELKRSFHGYFEKDLFVYDENGGNKDVILKTLCRKLHDKNYVPDDFEEHVYEREHAASTAFGNIAIPHSVNMDAIKTSVAVAVCNKGYEWNGSAVNLVFLIAINRSDRQKFRELYESLISLFSEGADPQKLKDCSTFEKFTEMIFSLT